MIDALKAKCDVKYCIPDWLRDEQIKMSVAKYPRRISAATELKNDPIAVVCFGPSLNKTWEAIKDFKYVMTCSGSHKFMREKGIIPSWHVEVDPRPHKVKLIGDDIHPDTDFLIASCCHPLVFEHIEKHGGKVTLWHTYSGESKDRLPLVYPRGEWVLTGGANVGLRALTIARFLGFTDIHIFGMDGSFDASTPLKHASFHPNICKDHIIATYEGKEYATTTAFLECARMTFHELEMLPDVNATFYGEGLVQDMAKTKVLNRKKKNGIAFFNSPVISEDYIKQNSMLHKSNPVYGTRVIEYVDTIKKLYDSVKGKSLLDYGCGKGMLGKNLDFPIWEYDPAVMGKDNPPRPADLVVCCDVMEHIEPEYLDNVLEDIARCTKEVCFFAIGTTKTLKNLPDGRSTHLTQEGKDWWMARVSKYFNVPDNGVFVVHGGQEILLVASAKKFRADIEKMVIQEAAV